jgi:hypothetical protein
MKKGAATNGALFLLRGVCESIVESAPSSFMEREKALLCRTFFRMYAPGSAARDSRPPMKRESGKAHSAIPELYPQL